MQELRQLLEDLTGSPAPAPRAASDALFDARRRTVVAAALATVPILAVAAAIGCCRGGTPPARTAVVADPISTTTCTCGGHDR